VAAGKHRPVIRSVQLHSLDHELTLSKSDEDRSQMAVGG